MATEIDQEHFETDVLIIGGGAAATMAAFECASAGVGVIQVTKGSTAERAGVKTGDKLVQIGERKVGSNAATTVAVRAATTSQKVRFSIMMAAAPRRRGSPSPA